MLSYWLIVCGYKMSANRRTVSLSALASFQYTITTNYTNDRSLQHENYQKIPRPFIKTLKKYCVMIRFWFRRFSLARQKTFKLQKILSSDQEIHLESAILIFVQTIPFLRNKSMKLHYKNYSNKTVLIGQTTRYLINGRSSSKVNRRLPYPMGRI